MSGMIVLELLWNGLRTIAYERAVILNENMTNHNDILSGPHLVRPLQNV